MASSSTGLLSTLKITLPAVNYNTNVENVNNSSPSSIHMKNNFKVNPQIMFLKEKQRSLKSNVYTSSNVQSQSGGDVSSNHIQKLKSDFGGNRECQKAENVFQAAIRANTSAPFSHQNNPVRLSAHHNPMPVPQLTAFLSKQCMLLPGNVRRNSDTDITYGINRDNYKPAIVSPTGCNDADNADNDRVVTHPLPSPQRPSDTSLHIMYTSKQRHQLLQRRQRIKQYQKQQIENKRRLRRHSEVIRKRHRKGKSVSFSKMAIVFRYDKFSPIKV